MKLTITIDMDNAAFDRRTRMEVRRILDNVTDGPDSLPLAPGESIKLRDINGNTVGKAEVTE